MKLILRLILSVSFASGLLLVSAQEKSTCSQSKIGIDVGSITVATGKMERTWQWSSNG